MTLVGIGMRNAWRNRIRALLTMLGVAVAVVAFLLIRTIVASWTSAADHAAQDRLGTRHRVTFILPLPLRYVEQVRNVPGVEKVTWANWFGGKNPRAETSFFGSIAVDPESFLEVQDELVVPADQRARWLENRRGALIGDALAHQFGWKVGDKVTLTGTIYPGDWDFVIEGIYTASRRTVDRSSLFFHWDYLNESTANRQKDQIGWIMTKIRDSGQSATIAQRIDGLFAEQDAQTLTMSEHAMQASFLGMLSTILKALDIVSIVILVIMALILGNTIAMSVRERTHEYGVLRAIGFLPHHLAGFVVGEAVVIGALGGAIGVLLSYPFIQQGVGRFLEENMGAYFPYVRIVPEHAALAAGVSILLAAAVAAIPAYRTMRLDVVDSLRRVG
jgi:putative ABC transport system permease protein